MSECGEREERERVVVLASEGGSRQGDSVLHRLGTRGTLLSAMSNMSTPRSNSKSSWTVNGCCTRAVAGMSLSRRSCRSKGAAAGTRDSPSLSSWGISPSSQKPSSKPSSSLPPNSPLSPTGYGSVKTNTRLLAP